VALKHGWLQIDETATPGILGRIEEHVNLLLENRKPRSRRHVTGISLPAGMGGFTTNITPEMTVGHKFQPQGDQMAQPSPYTPGTVAREVPGRGKELKRAE